MKNIVVVVSGVPGNNIHEVTLERGVTARDLLGALGLEGYLLSREGAGGIPFSEDEVIYDQVADGAKLRAVPTAEVGMAV